VKLVVLQKYMQALAAPHYLPGATAHDNFLQKYAHLRMTEFSLSL